MSSYPLLSVIFGAAIVGAQNVPQIDFSRMGTVGIAGAFAGLDLYNASAPTLDSSAATLVSRNSDGALTILGGTNGGGQLLSSCSLKDTLYVGGVFDSVAGISARNVIAYTPSSGKFSPLGSDGAGVDGEVNALHCDSSSGLVWVGGNFRRPTSASESSGFGGAVAVFNPSDNTWSPAPFDGFRGQVLDIAPSTDGKSLYFGGSFATTFGSNSTLNATNNPAVPYSPGATPFSASLVPIPLNGSEITAQPASSDSNFNNILDILCPAGNDGPGNTWLGADSSTASITARPFKFINAGGIRLGNTAINGRSTTAFTYAALLPHFCSLTNPRPDRLTTIPDNNVLELTYNDPATNQTRTCTDSCPLAPSSAALYQDFLFTTSQQITGFQLRLTQWSGSGPGLHILQLLSNDTLTAGTWVTTETATSIPGTTQNILVATVPVGTSSANSPSITWNSYVSGSGEYEVYLMIPGCTRLQDCDARTSVKVTVSPGGAIAPASTTISQRVSDDTQALVYRGPVIPSTPDYRSTVTLQLADNPEGSGQGGQYHLVADRVQFVLTSVGTSGNGTGNSTAPGSGRNGFGFFEWPLSASATNATGILPNTTITPFDALAFTIPNATASIHAIAPYSASRLFAGGNFTTAAVGDDGTVLGGSFSAIRKYGADGWAVLENGPTVKPLGALLDHTTAASTTPTASTANNAKVRRNWFSHMTMSDLFIRQQTSNTLPAPPSAPAPAVLAGTFYSNQSISQLTILGGNFTFANGQAKNLAFYDTDTNKLTGVQGTQVEGVVRALYVKGDELFVGGQFTLQGNEGSGLATYGLASGAWESNENVGLTTASGSTVVVRSITGRPSNDDTVIVAGSFASAGKLTCEAVCQWSIQNKQWSTLGSGIRGDVSSVAYAGSNAELLVVAGALTLADGTPANVAMYSFDNSTWIAVGGTNGIFAAGRASDGSAPFLTHWDGQQWNALSTDFASSTEVTQLAMVPLSDPHNGNGVLQNNRVLFMSGSLASNSFGSASTALFDGATVYPYISTTSTSGSTGFVNGLFYSVSNFSFELRKFLPRGVVILISIAIAAGIVFLLLLIGVLWAIFSRRDDQPQEEYVYQEADDESLLHRPSSLLEHINAATRNTIVGSVAGGIFPGGEKAVTPDPTDGTHMGEDEDGMGAGQVYNDPDGEGRFALARYSFVPSGDGELALEEGTQVVVLDDRDPAWWFVRNEANGQEGVVPASYLS
ncbi:polarized growth protein rax2 [Rhizoctonia solani]|uniref:Polarized growth protein rax2 n=1 Tax=Rhizoctonia solani TaxID=456999 RepID=A0A8H8SXQ9_9AGAM|nr:polarized growth protein rax2 [Rhizoctonia solani]QRW21629.1 polarized growth protein rax2 [Rhizoctonia solani]